MSLRELTASAAVPATDFWHSEQVWPRNGKEYQFLGRAVLAVARRRYGDEWQVPGAPLRRPWARKEYASRHRLTLEQVQEFLRALAVTGRPVLSGNKSAAEIAARVFDESTGQDQRQRLARVLMGSISIETWRVACDSAIQQVEERARHIDQWDALKGEVVRALGEGGVETFLRPEAGGRPQPAPADSWETEYERQMRRLDACRMSPTSPFDASAEDLHFIYVDQHKLIDALIVSEPPMATATPQCPGASDYMEVMLSVWHNRFNRAAHQHKATEVQAAIREAFDARGWLVNTSERKKNPNRDFVNHVAQVLRGYEASKGGRGRSKADTSRRRIKR